VIIPNGQINQSPTCHVTGRAVIDVPLPATADINRVNTVLQAVGEDVYADPSLRPLMLDAPIVMGVESIDVERSAFGSSPARFRQAVRGRSGAARSHRHGSPEEGITLPARARDQRDAPDADAPHSHSHVHSRCVPSSRPHSSRTSSCVPRPAPRLQRGRPRRPPPLRRRAPSARPHRNDHCAQEVDSDVVHNDLGPFASTTTNSVRRLVHNDLAHTDVARGTSSTSHTPRLDDLVDPRINDDDNDPVIREWKERTSADVGRDTAVFGHL